MADILCCGCGNILEARQRACSRCGRCPKCGTRVPAGDAHCPTCGHPGDDNSIKKLEDSLNPSKPGNARAHRWLQRGWENEQIMRRIRFWRVLLVLLFVDVPLSVVIGLALVGALSLPDNWGAPIMLLFNLMFMCVLVNLLRNGYFPWLLRQPETRSSQAERGA
jgi:hypothetical protein